MGWPRGGVARGGDAASSGVASGLCGQEAVVAGPSRPTSLTAPGGTASSRRGRLDLLHVLNGPVHRLLCFLIRHLLDSLRPHEQEVPGGDRYNENDQYDDSCNRWRYPLLQRRPSLSRALTHRSAQARGDSLALSTSATPCYSRSSGDPPAHRSEIHEFCWGKGGILPAATNIMLMSARSVVRRGRSR